MSVEATGETRSVVTSATIREILVERAGVDPDVFAGNESLSLTELQIDSLAVLELQAVLVERFGVEVPDEAVTMTVGEIAAVANEGR
ncbi:acyl carrier protein [Frankia sp. CiP1_Cm_nod1]|uniref:acyl carrier protein n=1 Tax=Frankia sp. CiP1_Cm_nod1 TaxID=2897160 RepID=UPI0020253F09